ncbi:MAG: hypothetical protein ACLP8S_18855 [Solirubrobacteraceae bacterium]
MRDLRVYAQTLDGAVYHYRDQTGLEVDAIVDTGERWGAFEVKLGHQSHRRSRRAPRDVRWKDRHDQKRPGSGSRRGRRDGLRLRATRRDPSDPDRRLRSMTLAMDVLDLLVAARHRQTAVAVPRCRRCRASHPTSRPKGTPKLDRPRRIPHVAAGDVGRLRP